jgi:hypothetical protein
MRKIFPLILISLILMTTLSMVSVSADEPVNPYFDLETIQLEDGTWLDKMTINGPPTPPPGFEKIRQAVPLPPNDPETGTGSLTVPTYNWYFGCSATSGSMIAAYYDRGSYPSMYTGPSNGGVMPMDNSMWAWWNDGHGGNYQQNPLTASHNGLDGRVTRGSIDDYWFQYGSTTDPYFGNWVEHTWGDAIGDYMKTSHYQVYGNTDGNTVFYTWTTDPGQLTCANMVTLGVSSKDGTYGRKLFYEARGYTVTTCYNQKTNNNGGNFTWALYKAEIDAGRPVMLNLEGHTVVGVGYADPSTV